jgi:hypothetical protein
MDEDPGVQMKSSPIFTHHRLPVFENLQLKEILLYYLDLDRGEA